MPLTCDLAVLGAGPAGLAAAAHAAAVGMDTVLVARRGAMADDVRVLAGTGRLEGPGRVRVALAAGGDETLAAAKVVLAPGLRPAPLPSLVADADRILDWRQFAATPIVADAVLVVGAGVLGVALASQLAQAGRAVTLAEMRESVLGEIDPELAGAAAAALRAQGVDLLTATRVVGADATAGGVTVRLLDIARGEERELAVPLVVLAAGRRPDTRDLGLETVTVETDRRGHLLTDANQETATPGLYAAGGAVPTVRTPTVARREARQAVDHAAGRPTAPIRYRELPGRCDLQPELAWVGLDARAAEATGRVVRAAAEGTDGALVKLVADAETGELLGAQLMGRDAAVLAAELGRSLGRPVSAAAAGSNDSPLTSLWRRAVAGLQEAGS